MIGGVIPNTLASLSKLQAVAMYGNHLTGNLPENIGNLSSLELIAAASNNFTGGLPESLGRLRKLAYVYLGDNKFSGTIPSAFFNISSLTEIHFPKNKLHGVLPQDLGLKLPNLENLNLGNNSFSGTIPISISNASNLMRLTIPMNNFSGSVPSLENLNRLQWISITLNQLGTGGIEDDLGFLGTINSTDLELLAIGQNNFGGKLPEAIGNLSSRLNIFSVEVNRISGNVPASIGNLRNLESLVIGSNQFVGRIPATIGNLWQLKLLRVRENRFTGEIPSSLGNLTMLLLLDLAGNHLEGKIPASLGKCRNLEGLDLSNNKLGGDLPLEVLSITSLSIYLDVAQNQLSGPIPREIGNLKQLTSLYAFENNFSGEIPSSLGECTSLTELVIDHNSFDGNISSFLMSLTSSEYIDLSSNNFSGPIPSFLGKFQFLEYLNLSFNHFEGKVPEEGVFRNLSGVSVQGNDEICGGITGLNLSPCHVSGPSRSSSTLSRTKIIVICMISAVVSVALLLTAFYLFRKKGRRTSTSPEVPAMNGLWQVSYETLQKATAGFDPSNLIGTGGFGAVYKGILEDGDRTVAVKVLDLSRRGASNCFMAECEALRNIRHRNLVKIVIACSSIDFGGNEFKALVYEFMKNGNLDEWLHSTIPNKTLSFARRLGIAIDVASALEYLHDHSEATVVHCDLKPSNVLLDDDMIGHVGDFGLARIFVDGDIGNDPNVSSSVGVRGTIGYAAPEYGTGSKVLKEGDVYSFGILLLEMFTGKRPTDESLGETRSLHDYCDAALSAGRAFEIMDPGMLQESRTRKFYEPIEKVLRIGVSCSMDRPIEWMRISDVAAQLRSLKNKLPRAR